MNGDAATAAKIVHQTYAAVTRELAREGIRCLAIKGPVLGIQELRSPDYQSADVDLLVDPRSHAAAVEFLAGRGWMKWNLVGERSATVIAPHSTTLSHSRHGLEADLHWRYPGIELDDSAAFELLWSRHVHESIAGVPTCSTEKPASAVIAALHYRRMGPAGYPFLYELAQYIRSDPKMRHAVAELARELLCEFEIRAALGELANLYPDGVRPDEMVPTAAAGAWGLKVRFGEQPGLPFWAEWNRRDFLGRWRLVRTSIIASDDLLRLREGRREMNRKELLLAQWRRWDQGARGIITIIGVECAAKGRSLLGSLRHRAGERKRR